MKRLSNLFIPAVLAALIIGAGAAAGSSSVPGTAAPSVAGLLASARSATLAVPTQKEDLYVPITPCRIVDTRSGTSTNGTPIANGQTRSYYVGGTFGFAPQGGRTGGCGIPTNASAIAATLTAVTPSNGGFLRAWPAGQPEPGATLLNYGTFSMGTGATVSIAVTSGKSLTVKNYQGPTELVIDVSGYYASQLQAQISSAGIISNGSYRVLAVAHLNTGFYRVQFDTDVSRCAVQATTRNFGVYASVPTLSGVYAYVYVWSLSSTGTPSLYNSPFGIVAAC